MPAYDTVKLQPKYTRYAVKVSEGDTTDEAGNKLPTKPDGGPLAWEDWLHYHGYKLDGTGNAAPMNSDEAQRILNQYR